MIQVLNTKAKLDFTNKTIEFEGDYRLSDLRLIQESLKDWREWRVINNAAVITCTPPVQPWSPYPYTWISTVPERPNSTITVY